MPDTITLTDTDSPVSRNLVVHQDLILHLEENPSTGYRWAMEASPPEAIEVLSTRWIEPAAHGVGGAGTRELLLQARKPGEVRLRLKLWREWQGESSVLRRCDFTLNIH